MGLEPGFSSALAVFLLVHFIDEPAMRLPHMLLINLDYSEKRISSFLTLKLLFTASYVMKIMHLVEVPMFASSQRSRSRRELSCSNERRPSILGRFHCHWLGFEHIVYLGMTTPLCLDNDFNYIWLVIDRIAGKRLYKFLISNLDTAPTTLYPD